MLGHEISQSETYLILVSGSNVAINSPPFSLENHDRVMKIAPVNRRNDSSFALKTKKFINISRYYSIW